jgi:hypothetical protein
MPDRGVSWIYAEPMLFLLTQTPIVVDLTERPEPARDISIDVVIGIFATTGWFLLAAAIGSGLVAASVILYKRWRDASAPATQPPHTHTSLGI